jgi:hypothetical protein
MNQVYLFPSTCIYLCFGTCHWTSCRRPSVVFSNSNINSGRMYSNLQLESYDHSLKPSIFHSQNVHFSLISIIFSVPLICHFSYFCSCKICHSFELPMFCAIILTGHIFFSNTGYSDKLTASCTQYLHSY